MMNCMLVALWVSVVATVSTSIGQVSARAYLADGNTHLELADPNIPFVYQDIMVGTRLKIIVNSDADGYWSGDLAITGEDLDRGFLSARDYNETTLDWAGSRLPSAGDMARVWEWEEAGLHGFSLQGDSSAVAEDWFVIDYTATKVGTCNVGFYDHSVSFFEPVYYLTFFHVPTRDFNGDAIVDLSDFAIFAPRWQVTACQEPDWCAGTDLDRNGWVDYNDVILFADYWLEKTE